MNATGIFSNRFLHAYLRLPGKLRVPYHVHVQFSSFFHEGRCQRTICNKSILINSNYLRFLELLGLLVLVEEHLNLEALGHFHTVLNNNPVRTTP